MQEKAFDFIKGNIMNLVVIGISVAYIFYGMLVVELKGVDLWQLITQSIMGIIVGLLIKQGVGENGFTKGYNSLIWKDSFLSYREACNIANDYIDRVDNFYASLEIEKKREYRTKLLMGYNLQYAKFFDNFGFFIASDTLINSLTKMQKKAVFKAQRVKIYTLNLFSEYSTDIDKLASKETTDKDQRNSMLRKNSLTQVISAVIGAYIIPMWDGWSWSRFIASTVQVLLWTICGVIELYKNFNYITIDKTDKLTRKKELIVRFVNECDKGMHLTNPYMEINDER